MKTWTAFIAPGRAPVLVVEGFSWGAALFGPLWLAAMRAWSLAVIVLAVDAALAMLTPGWTLLVSAFVLGLFGQDLRRVSLAWHGYSLAHVVAASSADGAFGRLLAARPDLVAECAA